MAGYVIYNGFWNKDVIPDTVQRLIKAASAGGLELTPVANCDTVAEFNGGVAVSGFCGGDFALFWDKDIRLARALEAVGVRLYNPSDTVAVCDDKGATHLKLAAHGLPMPRTLVAPMTYDYMDKEKSQFFLESAGEKLGFPMVVKECYGSLGGQVYLARHVNELRELVERMEERPFICQQYIAASAGTDIRVYVVDGEPIAAMRRHSSADFRANIGGGGTARPYSPTAGQKELAVTCCRILGALFAGVDLLIGPNGETLVCEVNSNAHMAAITQCTGVDVAGVVIDAVLKKEQHK